VRLDKGWPLAEKGMSPPSPMTREHPMTEDDVEIIEKTTPFKGYFQIDRYRLRHRLFEGGWSGEMVREVFERGHAVAVLLLDPVLDRVVLIEQFRPGAFAALASPWFGEGWSSWLIETVAGIIEDGESPEDVAQRETHEESGCEILDLVPICHYLVSPGGTSESVFVYLGRVDATKADGIHGMDAEHENIRALTVPTSEALGWLDEGRIVNAMTIIALQWLRANHAEMLRRWR
jgi:ADP-ribose pyrophosphatase